MSDPNEMKKYRFTKKGHYPSGYEEGEIVEMPVRCAVNYEHWIPVEDTKTKELIPEQPIKALNEVNDNISAVELMFPERGNKKKEMKTKPVTESGELHNRRRESYYWYRSLRLRDYHPN